MKPTADASNTEPIIISVLFPFSMTSIKSTIGSIIGKTKRAANIESETNKKRSKKKQLSKVEQKI
jgi:hypothetical protein